MQSNKIICGDALEVLRSLPDELVQTVVTSPPYWGLRDYGVPGQLGLEQTPEEYISKMVDIFREIKRVLRKDGTVWLNLGDSYSGGTNDYNSFRRDRRHVCVPRQKPPPGLKRKNLIGIPWRVALALQGAGWYLRSDIIEEVLIYCPHCGWQLEERIWRHGQDREIIWKKPNPMPESITDRPTKAHEYIFLLSRSQKYYYDADAIKEPASYNTHERQARARTDTKRQPTDKVNAIRTPKAQRVPAGWDTGPGSHNKNTGRYPKIKNNPSFDAAMSVVPDMRNKRTVWDVATQPYSEAHFATFPEKLITPCILAGCPEGGLVLDPFMGSGTTALVARNLNRKYLGIELNPEYIKISERRLQQIRAEI